MNESVHALARRSFVFILIRELKELGEVGLLELFLFLDGLDGLGVVVVVVQRDHQVRNIRNELEPEVLLLFVVAVLVVRVLVHPEPDIGDVCIDLRAAPLEALVVRVGLRVLVDAHEADERDLKQKDDHAVPAKNVSDVATQCRGPELSDIVLRDLPQRQQVEAPEGPV